MEGARVQLRPTEGKDGDERRGSYYYEQKLKHTDGKGQEEDPDNLSQGFGLQS